MLANTKAVRSVLKSFNIVANYTDKSSVNDPNTRIVVSQIKGDVDSLLQLVRNEFTKLGYTNDVYMTGVIDWSHYAHVGGTKHAYLRIKTVIA